MSIVPSDRRHHPRVAIRTFGKVYDPRSRKYLPCATMNLSDGGALIEFSRPVPLEPGCRVRFGLSAHDHPAMLRSRELHEVEVVRALPVSDGRQGVAVRYLAPLATSLLARSAAA